jgi:hypothetical protein
LLCRKAIIFELRFFIISSKNFFSFYCWFLYSSFNLTSALTSGTCALEGAVIAIGIGSLMAPGGNFGVFWISGFCFLSLSFYSLYFIST